MVEGQANSHKDLGWERLTNAAIRATRDKRHGVIFLFWGREANGKSHLIDKSWHTVLTAGHPSPLSYERYFKGCGHFQKVNELLSASHFGRNRTQPLWPYSQGLASFIKALLRLFQERQRGNLHHKRHY